MKKILSIALMALAVCMLYNCSGKSNEIKEPVIDKEKGTVNGIRYDKETYKCWLFEGEYTISLSGLIAFDEDEHDSTTEYLWLTEFDAQATKATWDYTTNQKAYAYGTNVKVTSTSKLTELRDKTEQTCYDPDDMDD